MVSPQLQCVRGRIGFEKLGIHSSEKGALAKTGMSISKNWLKGVPLSTTQLSSFDMASRGTSKSIKLPALPWVEQSQMTVHDNQTKLLKSFGIFDIDPFGREV